MRQGIRACVALYRERECSREGAKVQADRGGRLGQEIGVTARFARAWHLLPVDPHDAGGCLYARLSGNIAADAHAYETRVTQPFTREPDFGVTSVVYDLNKFRYSTRV